MSRKNSVPVDELELAEAIATLDQLAVRSGSGISYQGQDELARAFASTSTTGRDGAD